MGRRAVILLAAVVALSVVAFTGVSGPSSGVQRCGDDRGTAEADADGSGHESSDFADPTADGQASAGALPKEADLEFERAGLK